MDNCVLGWYNGWLCVIWTSPQSDKAIIIRHWWPVFPCSRKAAEEYVDKRVEGDGRYNGQFSLRHGLDGFASASWYERIDLKHGGKTEPIHTELIDYPMPKVRRGIEIRYRDGQWEKYLRTAGWVKLPFPQLDFNNVKEEVEC